MAISQIVAKRTGRVQFQSLFECVVELEAIWNPASVNSNSFIDEAIPVQGTHLGDMVLVSYEGDLLTLTLSAHVSTDDTISLHLINSTPGAIDLPESSIHVVVLRPQHAHKH